MENKINRMYYGDLSLILIFGILLWSALLFVMSVAAKLAPNHTVNIIILATGSVLGIFATGSLISLFVHLRRNRIVLYTQDIMCAQGKH